MLGDVWVAIGTTLELGPGSRKNQTPVKRSPADAKRRRDGARQQQQYKQGLGRTALIPPTSSAP